MTTATLEKRENLSTVVAALEKAHDLIREETGAPRATITIGRSAKVHGHFTPWTPWESEGESFHEIFLSASSFQRGARATLGTLLHETAHSLDNQAGRQGTSGDGYHNKIFKKTAEELGLKMEQVKGKGFTDTIVPDDCVTRWQEAFDLIESALNLMATADESARPKSRNKNLLVAECSCGDKIRLSLKTLEKCQPICTECESFFTVQEA